MKRLEEASVLLVGTGGVGSWCAEALVRTGIGRLVMVDADRVCASNVNRQLMATSETLGEPKVEALARRLREINPSANISAIAGVYSTETAGTFRMEEFEFVVDAIDSVADKAQLIRHALMSPATTLFSSMGAARKLDPLRIRVSEFWKVHGDGLARALRNRFRKSGEFPCRKFRCVWSDEPPVAEAGTVVHVTAAFGLALASLVVHDIVARPQA